MWSREVAVSHYLLVLISDTAAIPYRLLLPSISSNAPSVSRFGCFMLFSVASKSRKTSPFWPFLLLLFISVCCCCLMFTLQR